MSESASIAEKTGLLESYILDAIRKRDEKRQAEKDAEVWRAIREKSR